jgi:hypothetical protein
VGPGPGLRRVIVTAPCEEPHDGEAFAQLELEPADVLRFLPPTDDEPTDRALHRAAQSRCLPLFRDYVGSDFASSRLAISTLRPEPETWAAGDRSVVCSLYAVGLEPLVGSVRGSRR